MTGKEFIERLKQDNAVKRNTHKIGPPAPAAQITAWEKKHPAMLPREHLEFLGLANGFSVNPTRDSRGDVILLPLKSIKAAAKVIDNPEASNEDYDFSETLLGVGIDGNGDWFLSYDPATGKYCEESIIGGTVTEFDSFGDLLKWIASDHLHEIAPPAEKKKAGKAAKKGKVGKLREVVRILHDGERVTALSVTPDGSQVLTGCWGDAEKGDVVRLWGVPSGELVGGFDTEERSRVADLRVMKDGVHAVVGVARALELWDLKKRTRAKLVQMPGWISLMDYSPATERLLVSMDEQPILLCDARTGETVREYPGHKPTPIPVAFSPDGKLFASAGRADRTLLVRSVETGKEVANFGKLAFPAFFIAWFPDGKRLVTVGRERELSIWDVATNKRERTIGGHRKAWVDVVAVSRDGRRILSGGDDGYVRLWDAESGAEIANFSDFHRDGWCGQYTVTAVAITPDGRYGLCSNVDSTVRVLELP